MPMFDSVTLDKVVICNYTREEVGVHQKHMQEINKRHICSKVKIYLYAQGS